MYTYVINSVHIQYSSMSYLTISNFNFFFFNDTATTEIYTLSLHDALPIWRQKPDVSGIDGVSVTGAGSFENPFFGSSDFQNRSEEHTSELQSPCNLVCRLLLEKKKIELSRNEGE